MKIKKLALIIILCLISLTAHAAEITLRWNPGPEPDIKEYRLYETFIPGKYTYGKDSENYVATIVAGTETITIFVEDEDVDLLYWVLTAVNNDDLESDPSNEACIEEPEPSNGGGGSGCFILIISKVRKTK